MTIELIALGYICVGGVIAAAIAIVKRPPVVDIAMITALWPLYAPLVLVMRAGTDRRELELVNALARARSSPLAPYVPDEATARTLGHRVRDAASRLAELDAAIERLGAAPGSVTTRDATAAVRARTVAHLDDIRQRYRSDLDDITEMTSQLLAHAELAAWNPATLDEATDLIADLVARLDRLHGLEYDAAVGCSP